MIRHRSRRLGFCLLLSILAYASPLAAQAEENSFAGGALGFLAGSAAGLVVGLGVLSTRALVFEEALYGEHEFGSWAYLSASLGAGAGALYGTAHWDDLGEAMIWVGGGLLVGGAAGLFLGSKLDDERAMGWGAIGASIGVLGAVVLALSQDGDSQASALRAPLTLLSLEVP